MAGIRVSWLSHKCTEREIKIHFTKPENGGGPVKAVYYPLFDNNAVVIFEDPMTIETVKTRKHVLMGEELIVTVLLFPQMYSEIEARLDPNVAAFIQATDDVRDELQYNRNVDLCYDEEQNLVGIRGNWYLLEWVWAYIEDFARQQKQTLKNQHQVSSMNQTLTRQRTPSPGEVSNPMRSVPSALESKSSASVYPANIPRQHRDSATADIKPNVESSATDKETKKSKMKPARPNENTRTERVKEKHYVSDEDDDEDDGEDTVKKLAGLTLLDEKESVTEITILNDKPEDMRSLDFQCGPITVSVHSGLITMAETQAIVNAANGFLGHYGGVAGAIAEAAGSEMQRQCEEYVHQFGSVPTMEVMHTCAGGKISLNVKYVIHAVGPIWTSEQDRKCGAELTQTFLNCLVYGNDVLKIDSVTMPVISSGVFGCPLEVCVTSFLNAVLLYGYDHLSDTIHLKEVNLVNNNSDNTAMTVLHLRQLISKDVHDLITEARKQIQHVEERCHQAAAVFDWHSTLDYSTALTPTAKYGTADLLVYQNSSSLSRKTTLLSGVITASPFVTDSAPKVSASSRLTSKSSGYDLWFDEQSSGLHKAAGLDRTAYPEASLEKKTSGITSDVRGERGTYTSLTKSVQRDLSTSSGSYKDGKGDQTERRRSGPPTSSYLYESELAGTSRGATSGFSTGAAPGTRTGTTLGSRIGATYGRPLPPTPGLPPRQVRKS